MRVVSWCDVIVVAPSLVELLWLVVGRILHLLLSRLVRVDVVLIAPSFITLCRFSLSLRCSLLVHAIEVRHAEVILLLGRFLLRLLVYAIKVIHVEFILLLLGLALVLVALVLLLLMVLLVLLIVALVVITLILLLLVVVALVVSLVICH